MSGTSQSRPIGFCTKQTPVPRSTMTMFAIARFTRTSFPSEPTTGCSVPELRCSISGPIRTPYLHLGNASPSRAGTDVMRHRAHAQRKTQRYGSVSKPHERPGRCVTPRINKKRRLECVVKQTTRSHKTIPSNAYRRNYNPHLL